MRRGHITNLLDRESVRRLAPGVRATIEFHCANCPDCRNAYSAAIAAQDLIAARAAQLFEPSPFFPTRVMAVIRERDGRRDSTIAAGLAAANNALRAALASMILVVMLLFAVTLYFGGKEVGELEQPSDSRVSTESTLLEGDAGDDLSDLQVMSILYEPVDSDEHSK